MGKHKTRKTPAQKYRLQEGSYKRALRHQLQSDGTRLFTDGSIDSLDINYQRKISQNNRRSS